MGTNGEKSIVVKRIIVFLLLMIALLAVAFVTGCRNPFAKRQTRPPRPPTGPGTTETSLTCPIDGQPIAEDLLYHRPLAVMIENSPAARPQSGLNDACVVYEAITEGGITRFLAIFYHGSPKVIGPVRSARPHFINLEREYDAGYAHCGQSYEALQILASTPMIYNLDQLKYPKPFWRDHSRNAPHNLYASTEKLRAFVLDHYWDGAPSTLPKFVSTQTLTTGDPATTVDLGFGGAVHYKLRLVYDQQRGAYLRYMDGKLHVDRETKQPVVVKNIIIQYVKAMQFPDSKYHTYDVSVIDSSPGAGIFISNGHQIPINWSKDTPTDITRYRDGNGGELPFLPGQTWVELIPTDGGKVNFQGPQPTQPAP